jgi:hypothetical protein
VRAAEPQIAGAGYRVLRQRRRSIGFLVMLGINQQRVDFTRIKAGEG